MSPTIRYPMTSTDRLDEVARLLALGYLRLRARRRQEKASDPNHLRNFGLDFAAEGSVSDTDKRYRSLSAVARSITGTQWSGPLFFGLRKTGSGG
jgi:hypothetical protein